MARTPSEREGGAGRRRASCRQALIMLMTVCLFVGTAEAQAKPTVSFRVPAQSTAGQPIVFSWSTHKLPREARVVLQRQVGTGLVWRTAEVLHGSSGHSTTSPRAPGRYHLRVAVLASHSKLIAKSDALLDVFGEVPLSTLLNSNVGTEATPTATFSYALRSENGDGAPSPTQNALTVSASTSHCRSIRLEFLATPEFGRATETTTVTGSVSVVQEAADPVTVPMTPGVVDSLEATLAPKQSWGIADHYDTPTIDTEFFYGVVFYFNGIASCDTAEPIQHS